jgi:hypothetical protein
MAAAEAAVAVAEAVVPVVDSAEVAVVAEAVVLVVDSAVVVVVAQGRPPRELLL